VVEQRYEAVRAVIADGETVTEVAARPSLSTIATEQPPRRQPADDPELTTPPTMASASWPMCPGAYDRGPPTRTLERTDAQRYLGGRCAK